MKLVFLLASFACFGQSIPSPGPGMVHSLSGLTFDNHTTIYNGGSGSATAMFTTSGTNLTCVAFVVYLTSAPSVANCGGISMTQGASHASSNLGAGWMITSYQAVGLTAGSTTITITGSSYVIGNALTYSGAKQTGQPDAAFPYISGVTDGSLEAALNGTTVTSGSAVVGWYLGAVSFANSPSSNGTLVDTLDSGAGYVWRTTGTVAPAGATTLEAKSPNTPGSAYESIGLSIAPQ